MGYYHKKRQLDTTKVYYEDALYVHEAHQRFKGNGYNMAVDNVLITSIEEFANYINYVLGWNKSKNRINEIGLDGPLAFKLPLKKRGTDTITF
jgi:hypothetical protein